jgi:hypothetical protein
VLVEEATHSNYIVLVWPDRGLDQRSTAFASITPLTWSTLPKTNTCTWPRGSTDFSGHFVIPVLFMSSSVTQFIMLWFLSTHQPRLNWQRNPGSNVVVSNHFDSSRRLSLSSIKSQLLNVYEPSKELLSKYWGRNYFCITFSAQRRIFTISNDDFDQ